MQICVNFGRPFQKKIGACGGRASGGRASSPGRTQICRIWAIAFFFLAGRARRGLNYLKLHVDIASSGGFAHTAVKVDQKAFFRFWNFYVKKTNLNRTARRCHHFKMLIGWRFLKRLSTKILIASRFYYKHDGIRTGIEKAFVLASTNLHTTEGGPKDPHWYKRRSLDRVSVLLLDV